ncbi:DUF6879 family protein [Kitasatospora sp. LaBMicrA B282]|uniref:DUF6879 family protein n=1 Tax=Kitasatospora sp. LaBMicrA B282 TaxID=3420949 RepID=UPI003D12B7E0
MPEPIAGAVGERLSVSEYRADFAAREFAVDGHDSWKLERRQQFAEPTRPTWVAFAAGDWPASMRLNEERRAALLRYNARAAEHRIRLLRVRVVEEPFTPYLIWELHTLRLRAECGELIRVVDAQAVARHETRAVLPELVTLGPDTVYEIAYDAAGALAGAVRHTDPALTARVTAFIAQLYAQGEDLSEFFARRRVAGLVPPAGAVH